MSVPRRPATPQHSNSVRAQRARRPRARRTLNEFIEREIRSSGVVITIVIIITVAVINLVGPIQIWFEQQVRIAELRAQVDDATASLASAQAELTRWSDRAYVEAQARQRLMYVYPGDISYLVVNDVNAKPAKSTEVLTTVQATDINWVDAFLQSYAFAATTEAGNE